MKIEFDENEVASVAAALQAVPQQSRDILAVHLIRDYLSRGAHFYSDFARKLSEACIFEGKVEFGAALDAWRGLTEEQRTVSVEGEEVGVAAALRLLKAAGR